MIDQSLHLVVQPATRSDALASGTANTGKWRITLLLRRGPWAVRVEVGIDMPVTAGRCRAIVVAGGGIGPATRAVSVPVALLCASTGKAIAAPGILAGVDTRIVIAVVVVVALLARGGARSIRVEIGIDMPVATLCQRAIAVAHGGVVGHAIQVCVDIALLGCYRARWIESGVGEVVTTGRERAVRVAVGPVDAATIALFRALNDVVAASLECTAVG